MNQHPSLRLTPSNSPYFRSPTIRSPSKINKTEEPRLRLRKIIGTTTSAANGFDCLPSTRKFAYTAGAAAVVVTVGENLQVTQQFFRARPSTSISTRDGLVTNPSTPTPNESRSRALVSLKDANNGGLPWITSGREWSDSPIGKSLTAKDRIKAATSVALSPNGKWLAVGESGYKPRVLVFRITGDTIEEPVSIVAEHTFGVHALGFSPDSKYLASLGTANDGFLYVWSIDDRTGAATLSATNKCTNLINALAWMGQAIVTVGLRFAKVWRPNEEDQISSPSAENLAAFSTPRPRLESRLSEYGKNVLTPKHKVLSGKNSLLGDLLEANFVEVVPFQENKAYICADSGEICLLDDTDRMQTMTLVACAGFRVAAARLDVQGRLHVVGAVGQSKSFEPDELLTQPSAGFKLDRRKQVVPISRSPTFDGVMTVSSAQIDDVVVELDSLGGLKLSRSMTGDTTIDPVAVYRVPAHEAAVLGVHRMRCHALPEAAFFTFSGNGTIQVWNAQGAPVTTLTVPFDTSLDAYGWANELRAATVLNKANVIAVGDRQGTLSLVDVSKTTIVAQVRAHASEIVDVTAFEKPGATLISTGGRDRVVQLFSWADDTLTLIQTLDEHAGAITGILFTPDGEHLLSCSADRTVVVREAMLRDDDDALSPTVFAILRTITLRTTPTSMCQGAQDDSILVSTTDRCITTYNIQSGQTGFGFKCSDPDGGEAAVMSRILLTRFLNSDPTIIGVSSSDKSVRLYSEVGTLLARDWGHTEGITDVAVISDPGDLGHTIITVAADSTIFLWDTNSPTADPRPVSNESQVPLDLSRSVRAPPQPPLRKVLSHSELSRYRRRKDMDEDDSASPTEVPVPPISPYRSLRKKSSRASIAQPPKLEPTFRRKSLRQRSPSPPSPPTKALRRRPSLGVPLRSKSSDGTLSASLNGSSSTGFGTLSASTESICRTLRSYRKKLANSPNDQVSPEILRDVERELKLTARVLSQKSQGRTVIDEAVMARLLDQTSERIVNMLDERLKDREKIVEVKDDVDKLAGSLERVGLGVS